MKMKIAIASDMEGAALRSALAQYLAGQGQEVIDKGENNGASECAALVAASIAGGEAHWGILVSGAGVGVSIAANRFEGIRASVCPDTFAVERGAREEGMNVLCLGSGSVGVELSKELAASFVKAVLTREK